MNPDRPCKLPSQEQRLLIEIMEGVCCLSCTLAGNDERCVSWPQMLRFVKEFRRDRTLNVYHVGSACKEWRGTGGRKMEGRTKPVLMKDV